MKCKNKIVVLDLDETLGYFTEFGMIWEAFGHYMKKYHKHISIDQTLFNDLLDLYPEFLRPNIVDILSYLKYKKQQNHCKKLMIYTNNQGPEKWAEYIMNYFDSKVNYKLCDHIIGAFKIEDKHLEFCRTTHLKTHQDLVNCSQISPDSDICYIDDYYYPDMVHQNVYYINIKPYIHELPFSVLIQRILDSNLMNKMSITLNTSSFKKNILRFLKLYNHTVVAYPDETNVDEVISKKMLQHIHIYFNRKKNKTKRHVKVVSNRTRRRLS
jgi:hypothetical protein